LLAREERRLKQEITKQRADEERRNRTAIKKRDGVNRSYKDMSKRVYGRGGSAEVV